MRPCEQRSRHAAQLDLVDSHAHLRHVPSSMPTARPCWRGRAPRACATILAIGGGGSGRCWRSPALPFAERYDWIYAAAGIHPHEAQARDARALRKAVAPGAASALSGLGRDRPRLSLRPFAARRAAARLHRAAGAGARRAASRSSCIAAMPGRIASPFSSSIGAPRAWAAFSTASPARWTRRGAESKWAFWSRSRAT